MLSLLSNAHRNFTEWLNVSPYDEDIEYIPPSLDDSLALAPQPGPLTPSPTRSSSMFYRQVLSHTSRPDSLLFTPHIPEHMVNSPIRGAKPVPSPWTPPAYSSTHLEMLASPASLSSSFLSFDKTVSDPHHTPFDFSSADWKGSEPYLSPVIHSSVSASAPLHIGPLDTPFVTKLLTAVSATPPNNSILTASCTNHSLELTSPHTLPNNLHFPQLTGSSHREDPGPPNNNSASGRTVFVKETIAITPGIGPNKHPNTRDLFPSIPLSPLTPMSDERSSVPPDRFARKKRKRSMPDSPTPPLSRLKKFRKDMIMSTSSHTHATTAASSLTFRQRTFPRTADFEFHVDFALFYRRFPLSTFFQSDDDQPPTALFKARHPGGTYNPPRDAFDLYTPRFVKGTGKTKVGLCPICIEAPERGGEGKKLWLSMKFSAFKCYHMQYGHGISANTGLPFSPPTSFRMALRPRPAKLERSEMLEGKCHKCCKWIAIQGVKDVEAKVKEIFWWKHAVACHRGSNVDGEGDFYIVDDVHKRLKELND